MTRRHWVAAAVAVVAATSLTGCMDKAQEPYKDAPVQSHDNSPAKVIEMPDGFSNIAVKCDGTNRVYVIFHSDSKYGSIAVAPNDPQCGGTGPSSGATP